MQLIPCYHTKTKGNETTKVSGSASVGAGEVAPHQGFSVDISA